MAIIAAIALHLIAICVLAFTARWMLRRLPEDDRTYDVVGATVIGLILVGVMYGLPHWGFGH